MKTVSLLDYLTREEIADAQSGKPALDSSTGLYRALVEAGPTGYVRVPAGTYLWGLAGAEMRERSGIPPVAQVKRQDGGITWSDR